MTTETIESTDEGISEVVEDMDVTATSSDAVEPAGEVLPEYDYGDATDADPVEIPVVEESKTVDEGEASPDKAADEDERADAVVSDETPAAKPLADWLVELAGHAGMSPEDIASFPDEASLQRTVNFVMRKAGQAPAQEPPPPPEPVNFGFKSALDPDTVAPEIVEDNKAMSAHFAKHLSDMQTAHAKEIEDLKLVIGGVVKHAQQSQMDARDVRFNEFTQSSPEYKEVYADPAAVAATQEAAHVIAAGRNAMGMKELSEPELLALAHRQSQETRKQTQTQTSARHDKVKQRSSQVMARPTDPHNDARSAPSTPAEREALAVKNANAKLAEMQGRDSRNANVVF